MNSDRVSARATANGAVRQQHARQTADAFRGNTRLMTSREAAQRLCMSHEWLRKKVQRREVPYVRLGRYVRFTEAHLAEIIESATQPPLDAQGRGTARSSL